MHTLRPLTAADRRDFRELRRAGLAANPDDFMITAEEEIAIPRLFIEEALEQPKNCNLFVGAFTGPEPRLAGIAGLLTSELRKTRHCARITSVLVDPAHRHRGITRSLMENLLARAGDGGIRSVRLEVVAENRNAIAFYETLGFVPYGREPAAYRLGEREWDLLLMTRNT